MILEKQTEAHVLTEGQTQESIGMSLDLDSAQILMQMLSKNLYSDDIGSAIRECASNALDSHRRAGVDTPIVVSLKAASYNNYEFCVEDFGIGLDADDVRNIISKYGKSTKRNSATELGMMGLGFKAPLAYSSSFYFVCRKDGMERKYMMYEGEDTNTIDLLYETETTEANGVKIIIPVKYGDKYNFIRKIKEQLCYFESVYFDVPDDPSINNDFVISRHPDFQFSEMSTDTKLHICLDNVYYPLDFEKLGIDRLEFPLALRFSLSDGLFPTPNRESLRYTQEAKDIIKKKLGKVADYFIGKYNETVITSDDIKSMINYLEKSGHYVEMANNKTLSISPLIKYANIKAAVPELKGVTLLDFPAVYGRTKSHMLDSAYVLKFTLKNKTMKNADKHYVWGYNIENICNGTINMYVYQDRISQLKKDYMKSICNEDVQQCFVKPNKPMQLGKPSLYDSETYYHRLQLHQYKRSEWRQVIKEYQYILSLIEESFTDLDAIDVPQSFIDSRKKIKVSATGVPTGKRLKIQGEIICKKGVPLARYSGGRNCKFDSQLYKLEELHKRKQVIVYAKHEDSLKLDALYGMMQKQTMEVVTFSDRELKIVDQLEIHNLTSYDKFMEGKNAPFKRMITSYLVNQLIEKNRYVFDKVKMIAYTSTDLASKLEKLVQYKRLNYVASDPALVKSMLAVAEEHNLFDPSIYTEYLEMNALLERLYFLNPLCSRMGYYGSEDPLCTLMTDLFKYHKHRVNLEHYKIRINDEVLSEVSIEQLIN